MTRFPFAALAALLLSTLSGCASLRADRNPHPPVLLVSIDGLGAGQFDPERMPNLARIAREGARAAAMVPSYPTLTFPNHYSIVTGLHPDRHGIVHNTMRDAALGGFWLSNPEAVGDGRWWSGTPVWVAAERMGLPTAAFFWPGTEAAIDRVRPTRWRAYEDGIPLQTRVDTVLGWLSEPAATRPRFMTLYFEQVDEAAHAHGPHSAEAHAEQRKVDAALGRLLDGMDARGLGGAVNLVVVSDHGLAEVPPGNTVIIEDMVDPADVELVTAGQVVGFTAKPGREAAAERALIGRHAHYQCWRKGDLPARWHYGAHPRVPSIICQMDEGWDAVKRERLAEQPRTSMRGSHGFDPANASMHAVFFARGPAFRTGAMLPAIASVDVYPLLMRLLGLQAAPNDGNLAPLLPALRDRAE
ncbi:MAG: ectonucleotide pyrophosphatase/phosphodiesterase [Pseudomonadota bacterium]